MKTTLKLQNIKCGGCTNGITTKLLKLSGINDVHITDGASEVSFNYDTLNDLARAEQTLMQMGYPPEGAENTMMNKAKSFVSCATGKMNFSI